MYLYNTASILHSAKNILQNNSDTINKSIIVNITQKIHNPKAYIINSSHTTSFSVGSAVKFFKKASYVKAIRRSHRGVLIFINTIKAVLKSNYITTTPNKNILLNIQGFDYNLIYLKKHIQDLFKNINICNLHIIFNIKVNFTKKKDKKIKSIKKRLRKKMFANFNKGLIKIKNK